MVQFPLLTLRCDEISTGALGGRRKISEHTHQEDVSEPWGLYHPAALSLGEVSKPLSREMG